MGLGEGRAIPLDKGARVLYWAIVGCTYLAAISLRSARL